MHFRIFLPDDLGGGVLTVAIGEDSMKAKATIVDLKQQILDHTCQQRRATLGNSGKFEVKNYDLWYPPQPGTEGAILAGSQLVLSLTEPDLFLIAKNKEAVENLTQFQIGGLKQAQSDNFITGDANGACQVRDQKISDETELMFLYHDQSPYVHIRNSYGQYLSSQDSGTVYFTRDMGPWSQWVVEDEAKIKSTQGHIQYLFNVDGHYLQVSLTGKVLCSDFKTAACRFVTVGPRISGFLKRKTTSTFSKYQKKFFTLTDNAVRCWDNADACQRASASDMEMDGLVEVGGAKKKGKREKDKNCFQMSQISEIAWATLEEKNFSISLLPALGIKPLELLADSPEQARVWVEHIFRAKQHFDNEGFRLPSSKGSPVPPSTPIGCSQKEPNPIRRQTKHLSASLVEEAIQAATKKAEANAEKAKKEENGKKKKTEPIDKKVVQANMEASEAKQKQQAPKKTEEPKKKKVEQLADDFGLADLTLGSDLGDFTLGSDLDDSIASPKASAKSPKKKPASTKKASKATKAATPKKKAKTVATVKKAGGSVKKKNKKAVKNVAGDSEDDAAEELKREMEMEAAAKERMKARQSQISGRSSTTSTVSVKKNKNKAFANDDEDELANEQRSEAAAKERLSQRLSQTARKSPKPKKAAEVKKDSAPQKRRDSFDLSMASSLDLGLTDADGIQEELTLGFSDASEGDKSFELEESPKKGGRTTMATRVLDAKRKMEAALVSNLAEEKKRKERLAGLARQEEADQQRKEAAEREAEKKKNAQIIRNKAQVAAEAKAQKEQQMLEERLSVVRQQSEDLKKAAVEAEVRNRVEEEKRKQVWEEQERKREEEEELRRKAKEAKRKEANDRKLEEDLELRRRQTVLLQEQVEQEQKELKALITKQAEEKAKQEAELADMQREVARKQQEAIEREKNITYNLEMGAKLDLLKKEEEGLQRLKASADKRKRNQAVQAEMNRREGSIRRQLHLEQELKEEEAKQDQQGSVVGAFASPRRESGGTTRFNELLTLLDAKAAEATRINERHAKLKRTLAGRKQDFARMAHKFKTLKAQQNQTDEEQLKRLMRGISGQSEVNVDWKAVALVWQRRYDRSALELNSLKLQTKQSAIRRQQETDRINSEPVRKGGECESCIHNQRTFEARAAKAEDLERQLADLQGALLRQERHHTNAMKVARLEAENLQQKHLQLMESMVEMKRMSGSASGGGTQSEVDMVWEELTRLKGQHKQEAGLAKRQEEMRKELDEQLSQLHQNYRRLTAENNALFMAAHRRTTTHYQSNSIKQKAYVRPLSTNKESPIQTAAGVRKSGWANLLPPPNDL